MKVIIFCSISLDGKISKNSNEFVETSSEDKQLFASETKKAGVVIMGRKTFQTFLKPLKNRLNVVLTSNPVKFNNITGVVEFTSDHPRKIIRGLSTRGFHKVFIIGGSQVNSLFLHENLVNEIWVTIAPRLFGSGIELYSSDIDSKILELFATHKMKEGYLFLKYRLKI